MDPRHLTPQHARHNLLTQTPRHLLGGGIKTDRLHKHEALPQKGMVREGGNSWKVHVEVDFDLSTGSYSLSASATKQQSHS